MSSVIASSTEFAGLTGFAADGDGTDGVVESSDPLGDASEAGGGGGGAGGSSCESCTPVAGSFVMPVGECSGGGPGVARETLFVSRQSLIAWAMVLAISSATSARVRWASQGASAPAVSSSETSPVGPAVLGTTAASRWLTVGALVSPFAVAPDPLGMAVVRPDFAVSSSGSMTRPRRKLRRAGEAPILVEG